MVVIILFKEERCFTKLRESIDDMTVFFIYVPIISMRNVFFLCDLNFVMVYDIACDLILRDDFTFHSF